MITCQETLEHIIQDLEEGMSACDRGVAYYAMVRAHTMAVIQVSGMRKAAFRAVEHLQTGSIN